MAEGELPIRELSLGGTLTNWQDTIDAETKLTNFSVGKPLTTVVGDQSPAQDVTPRALFRVGDSYIRDAAKHCNFEGTECWNVKVHPVIDSVSASEGFATGGQHLEITGYGLDGEDIEVLVDNVPCSVKSTTETGIICETGAAQAPSVAGY